MTPSDYIKEFLAATKTHQWENVAPLIHPEAAFTFSTGEVHEGIDAIQRAFERNFGTIKNEKYEMTNRRWLLRKDSTAVLLFNFAWNGRINGQFAEGHGIGTMVLVKENGRWRLLTEHLGRA